jgi:4-amino-4-deoxy-L-arabinose transferase-like glycosyltransferase
MPSRRTKRASRLINRWYLGVAILLLLVGGFFRLWDLRTAPPGMSTDELVNAQLADHMRTGDVSVLYDEVVPAREGLYPALLAVITQVTGRGLLLWRLPSAWIAMLSLAVMSSLMKRLFSVRIALMSMGLMAVSFWPVWMGRAVLHVTVMPLLVSLTLYVMARAFVSRGTTSAALWFTSSGLMLGIVVYAHVTAWTMIVIPVVFVIYRWSLDREEVRRHWWNIFYAIALFAILVIPLAIFLAKHPGARALTATTGEGLGGLNFPGQFVQALAGLGLRGDIFVNHNLPGRPVLGPALSLLGLIGLGITLAQWRHRSYGLALIWLIVGLIPAALTSRPADFESMVVSMPVVFVFPAIGLRGIFSVVRGLSAARPAFRRLLPWVDAVVGLLIAANAAWTYRDYFIIWPELPQVRLNYQADLGALAHYLDTDADPTPIAICAPPVDRAEHPFALSNDQLLDYVMHRHDLNLRYFDCSQSLLFINGGETERLIFPRGHYYDEMPGPLLAWLSDAQSEPVPGVSPDTVLRVNVSRRLADTAGAFTTTAPVAWPPESGEFRLAPVPISFEHNVTFLGYSIRDETLHPSDYLELVSYWRLDGPPPPELTMFAHLLGNSVVVLAQNDNLGVNVAQLQTRDVFIQYSLLQTPEGISPGLYPVSVGLYLPSTNERLRAFENGAARGDRLFLKRITITAAP